MSILKVSVHISGIIKKICVMLSFSSFTHDLSGNSKLTSINYVFKDNIYRNILALAFRSFKVYNFKRGTDTIFCNPFTPNYSIIFQITMLTHTKRNYLKIRINFLTISINQPIMK